MTISRLSPAARRSFRSQSASGWSLPGLALVAAAALAGSARGQSLAWSKAPDPVPPSIRYHSMAFDSARDCTVLFGGQSVTAPALGETWELRDERWVRLHPVVAPAPRLRAGMAFDAGRAVTVLFGGSAQNAPLGETWEWTGYGWVAKTPTHSPPPMWGHAMTFDSARGLVLLFGTDGSTWTWDGTDWTHHLPALSPPPCSNAALAFDGARGRAVLFGGAQGFQLPSDTWEWDGTAWIQRQPTVRPAGRTGHAMCYDSVRQRIVMTGGDPSTWEWDGTDWLQHGAAAPPSSLQWHGMAYDTARGRAVLFTTTTRQTWTFDGTAWNEQQPSLPARFRTPMVFDERRDRAVLFGGTRIGQTFGDTWQWNGADWQSVPTSTAPPHRAGHGLSYDAMRGVVVLFGGKSQSGTSTVLLGDTWEFDGAGWHLRNANGPPPNREHAAMAYDRLRGRTYLYGGRAGATDLADTWAWDGANWTTTAAPPNPIVEPKMVFDSRRGVLVLRSAFGQLWESNGATWVQRGGPMPSRSGPLAYDPQRGVTVLFTDDGSVTNLATEVWTWDGSSWNLDAALAEPLPVAEAAFCYDTSRRRLVLFGGVLATLPRAETWEASLPGVAYVQPFGRGCGSPAPDLASVGGPPVVGTSVSLQVSHPANRLTLLSLGSSNRVFGVAPLPLQLAGAGMPGCELLHSAELLVFGGTQTSQGSQFTVALPNLPGLAGFGFHAQAIVEAPGQNLPGFVLTNGLTIVLGTQ